MPQKLKKHKVHTEKLGKLGILGIMLHVQGHRHLSLVKRPMQVGRNVVVRTRDKQSGKTWPSTNERNQTCR